MVEMFCEYDLGLDYSPRVHSFGIPGSCPNHDAINAVRTQGFPVLAPDLSAMAYGGRVALSKMVEALGKHQESQRWAEQAENLRNLIFKYCYDPQDQFFYDVDTNGNFRKFRETQLFLLCQEHVLTKDQFHIVWDRYLHDSKQYWLNYAFPSYSKADSHFRPRAGAWTGATFLNITLRTLLWMPTPTTSSPSKPVPLSRAPLPKLCCSAPATANSVTMSCSALRPSPASARS